MTETIKERKSIFFLLVSLEDVNQLGLQFQRARVHDGRVRLGGSNSQVSLLFFSIYLF